MFNIVTWCRYAVIVIITVVAITAVSPMTATAETSKTFNDVNEKTVPDKSMRQAIDELVMLTAIDGYGDSTFKPYNKVSRAQTAKMLTGAFGLSLPQNLPRVLDIYQDIDPDPYDDYAVYIAATTAVDFFKGKQDGKFHPWESMTRSQMAIVLARILEEYDTRDNVDVHLDHLDEEAKGAVQVIANLGVTTETTNFRPNEKVTRLQAAVFLYRAMKVMDANQ